MTEFDDDLADPDGDPPEAICGAKEVGALAHLYRAEVYRSTVWRQRLDQTTNWAVISTGIGLSVAFANAQASPFPIVLVGALCIVFLTLESRRYRFFYVWRFRRLRRNYGWLFAILGAAYFAKIAIHPTDVETWSQFVRRAHIGPIPGLVAISFGLLFHVTWISIAVKTWLDERHDKSKMADFLNSRKDVNAREDAQAEMDILGH